MSDEVETATGMTTEEADRIEELVRYIAEHDGRLPSDDLPLAWWLVDALDLEKDHPVRQALASIPIRGIGVDVFPKKAHAWNVFLNRCNQLVWADQRGRNLDDILPKDRQLGNWVNDMLSRHQLGTLGPVETLLLERTPLWDFDRSLDTRRSQQHLVFKVGIGAVREFYLAHKHTEIPEGYTVGGLDIHRWWTKQRGLYAGAGGLQEHLRQQLDRLSNLGVDMRTDKQRSKDDPVFRYRDRLAELTAFIAEHGMSELPERGDPFVNNARMWIEQYGRGDLDPVLEAALEAIEGWSWGEYTDLKAFQEFASSHGHLDMARDYVTEGGVAAGEELYRIRKKCWTVANPGGTVKRLGQRFDDFAQEGWERGTGELGDYFRRYGRMPESDRVTPSGFRLGAFMRQVYRKAEHGLLTRARLKELAGITGNSGWLEGDTDAYEATERVLARFARSHGNCVPPWDEVWGDGDGRDLSLFVLRVCADRKDGKLLPTETLRLESLPGWGWSRYERLVARDRAPKQRKTPVKEPVRSVRTDVADPDSKLNRSGLRQFLPGD